MKSVGVLVRPRFVDRRGEIEALMRLAEEGSPLPLFIYGPEGCGKTRLMEELYSLLSREGFSVVYVDARASTPREAVRPWSEQLASVLEAHARGYPGGAGVIAARLVSALVDALERAVRFRGRRVVVVVDEVVEAIGVESAESYAKQLYSLIGKLVSSYGAAATLVVATTSEGASRELLARHGYVELAYMWNLREEDTHELATSLGAPESIKDEVYEYTSGNPRAVIGLAGKAWKVDAWLEGIYREKILQLGQELDDKRLVEDLRASIEDPDILAESPRLRRILIKYNMIVYLGNPLIPQAAPQPAPEMGIGALYAWQVNAYRVLVRDRLLSLIA